VIHERGDLGIRVDLDESAAELFALVDSDEPGVVFRCAMTERQQFFKHHRDLDTVGRGQRVQLQRMPAYGQDLVVRRTRRRAVDVRETTDTVRLPGPIVRRRIKDESLMRISPRWHKPQR
jgi:hypothetical protein